MATLTDKAIVITGASRGLGRAFAIAAAAAGAKVVVNGRYADVVEQVVADLTATGGHAIPHVGSIASWDEAEALVAACVNAYGRIDGLVNNAGIRYTRTPLEDNEPDMRQIVEVNLLGSLFAGVHAIRAMAKTGGGSLVNIGSERMMGYVGGILDQIMEVLSNLRISQSALGPVLFPVLSYNIQFRSPKSWLFCNPSRTKPLSNDGGQEGFLQGPS